MSEPKCDAIFKPLGVKCLLEEGHMAGVGEESKHSHYAYIDNDGERVWFHVNWD